MTVRRAITRFLARRMNVPDDAIEMFRAANDFSGLSRSTLPIELIPLNTVTLARGLLNYTVVQTLSDWVLPYWAERQFDPKDPAFLPRAHGGLSINLSNRNWTAIGEPGCEIEPCVDPRGLVTPFRGRWSLDSWMSAEGRAVYPSQQPSCLQSLHDGLPIVTTRLEQAGLVLELCSYVLQGILYHYAAVHNHTTECRSCRLGISLRPFNMEGVVPLRSLRYDPESRCLRCADGAEVHLDADPDGVLFSDHARGDVATRWSTTPPERQQSVECEAGLAQACLWFEATLEPGDSLRRQATVALVGSSHAAGAVPAQVVRAWSGLRSRSLSLSMPDSRIAQLFSASLSTLILLCDQSSITPGPSTYHQFWFRDAAFMLWALDKAGLAELTEPVIRSFPSRQERSGFFRSQQGEWDSNGQALWTVWQHALFAHSTDLARTLAAALARGAQWIDRMRLRSSTDRTLPHFGLLPRGLSAEHLGHVDHYFWDNFWSVAGLEGALSLAEMAGDDRQRVNLRGLLEEYRNDLAKALSRAEDAAGEMCIPASPGRRADAGMIGSLCALYPLQLLTPDEERMRATLEKITERCFLDGMFYQPFIHSGLNTYLTLQVSHAWLYAGRRDRFWQILEAVVRRATPTQTYPEAIHPLTGCGVMGDGHHGWTAAEFVLALRDAFVFERWGDGRLWYDLVLLAGIPDAWFAAGAGFSIERCSVPGGTLSLRAHPEPGGVLRLQIEWLGGGPLQARRWLLRLPQEPLRAHTSAGRLYGSHDQGEWVCTLEQQAQEIVLSFRQNDLTAGR